MPHMIPRIEPKLHSSIWQKELAEAIRDPLDLLARLELADFSSDSDIGGTYADHSFPLRVPLSYVSRMEKGNPRDPLLRQVLPDLREQIPAPGFSRNPVGDLESIKGHGILHKYHGRVLLMLTGACPIHCRYCFRRHFPYQEAGLRSNQWQTALDTIGTNKNIREVILSGGDPLSMSDDRLAQLAFALEKIPHVDTLRIHTRMPVALPSRVDSHLIDWLGRLQLNKVVVLHINHANEIDASLASAINKLKLTGATLLNQSVLLAGVNDQVSTLEVLSRKLFQFGVLPYYLHQLDRVEGAAHFGVSHFSAKKIIAELGNRLPGYLVPKLVVEIPGAKSKLSLT